MPKETKRFINPLLRPSSNVEVEETKPEPVRKQSEPHVASLKTVTDTSTEISVPPVREAVPLPPIPPDTPPALPDVQAVESQTNDYVTYPSTETSTSQIEMEVQRESQLDKLSANEPRAEIRKSPSEIKKQEDVTIYPPSVSGEYANNTMSGSEPEFRDGLSSSFPSSAAVVPAPVSPVVPLPPITHAVGSASSQVSEEKVLEETTFVSPLPQTSTYTYNEQKRPARSPGYDEFVEQEYYTPPPVRRRRGAQSFEKTHERITVWVDKRLKQAFEELAYTEETSKTALLNEAIADLLRKHSSH